MDVPRDDPDYHEDECCAEFLNDFQEYAYGNRASTRVEGVGMIKDAKDGIQDSDADKRQREENGANELQTELSLWAGIRFKE